MKETKRKLILSLSFVFLLLIVGVNAFGEEPRTGESEDTFNNATVTIKYFDRTIYYPNERETNPVLIHISIKNNSTETLRFKLADDRMFSIDFNVLDIKSHQLPQTPEIIQKRTTDKSIYFREISIEYGEEYSFTENLKDYIQIEDPSIYYVQLRFYPELYKSKYLFLSSNRLTLEVHPSPSAAGGTLLPVKAATSELLQAEDLSPDKVIEQTIIARQKSLWDQYFLYMDIESLFQRNAAAKRKYNSVSADERERLLKEYKADLMQERIDSDIVAVPNVFEIEKVVYTKTEGTVTVNEWFQYPNYSEKKSYTYKIRRREGIWKIYDYVVTNLGTE